MPEIGAGADVVCRDADDLADGALVQQPAHGLELGGQEGVGRGADEEALGSGKLDDLVCLLEAVGQGLFAVDVLAGLQGGHGQAVVGGGIGEDDDDVHLRVCQHLVGGVNLGDVPARGGCLGGLRVQVRAAHRPQVLEHRAERSKIVIAVYPCPDHTVSEYSFFHTVNSFSVVCVFILFD